MADEKKYTERDATKRERAAFVKGALNQFDAGWPEGYGPGGRDALARHFRTFADAKYPLPKVTRPRVVNDPAWFGEWSVGYRHDKPVLLHRSFADTGWSADFGGTILLTPARVTLWADLFARPTEEIEDDGNG